MGSNVLINRLWGTHLFLDRQTCQQASLLPVSMHLAQVLIGREEAYHSSRDHVAQVTEDAARLLHLQKADKELAGNRCHGHTQAAPLLQCEMPYLLSHQTRPNWRFW